MESQDELQSGNRLIYFFMRIQKICQGGSKSEFPSSKESYELQGAEDVRDASAQKGRWGAIFGHRNLDRPRLHFLYKRYNMTLNHLSSPSTCEKFPITVFCR